MIAVILYNEIVTWWNTSLLVSRHVDRSLVSDSVFCLPEGSGSLVLCVKVDTAGC